MKVYSTTKLPVDLENIFAEKGIECEVDYESPSKLKILASAADKDAIICLLKDKIDSEIIDNAPDLKIIANYAVGYDNIDIEYAKEKGIYVTNTPDILTETTADLTFSLLLSCARRIVEADKFTRAGNFTGFKPDEMLGVDIYGKTLGIFGFGRIGQAIAKRALGFNMKILYTKRSKADIDFEAEMVDFEKLTEQSDFISINAPLNDETLYKFDYDVFKKMKKDSIIINTARGKIIREDDLVKALKERIIRYAGLDVFENEPDIHPELKNLDNVIITPHMGSATESTRRQMALMCVDSIIQVLIKKEKPGLCVNC